MPYEDDGDNGEDHDGLSLLQRLPSLYHRLTRLDHASLLLLEGEKVFELVLV